MRVMELESHELIRTKKTGEEMTVDEKRYQWWMTERRPVSASVEDGLQS